MIHITDSDMYVTSLIEEVLFSPLKDALQMVKSTRTGFTLVLFFLFANPTI